MPASTPSPQPDKLPGAHRTRAWWPAAGWWVLWVVLSLLVFALYMRPDFLLTVADQLWSCM